MAAAVGAPGQWPQGAAAPAKGAGADPLQAPGGNHLCREAVPAQLDLFDHALRHYHESLRCLGRLDLVGCRECLRRHQDSVTDGALSEAVTQACSWLQERLPAEANPQAGADLAVLCRLLAAAAPQVPALLRPGGEVGRAVLAAVARRGVALAAARGCAAADPVTPELPWGVFQLWAGDAAVARRALGKFLAAHDPNPSAWLALGQACAALGYADAAAQAWREGCGLDPTGAAWAPLPEETVQWRQEFADDPQFGGAWWAVGAYLEGRFPRYTRTAAAQRARDWRRFAKLSAASAPVRFFAGLALSEQGDQLPLADLAVVRRTLRDLHPEAYHLHLERLDELGPPAARPSTSLS